MLSVEKNLEFKKNLFPFIKDVKSATAFISNDLGIDSLICVPFFSDKKGEEQYLFIFCLSDENSAGLPHILHSIYLFGVDVGEPCPVSPLIPDWMPVYLLWIVGKSVCR